MCRALDVSGEATGRLRSSLPSTTHRRALRRETATLKAIRADTGPIPLAASIVKQAIAQLRLELVTVVKKRP